MADQYITFQPKKEHNPLPSWYPVVSTKLIQQTKSLVYLGKASFAICLLLLISYYEAYLSSTAYSLNPHMTECLEISTLLFMMQNSKNQYLHNMTGQRLGAISCCHMNKHIQTFKTDNAENSMTGCCTSIIYSYFPPHLHSQTRSSRTDKTKRMDFTNFNFLNASQLDNEFPDFFNRGPTNLNESSTPSFAKPPDNTNNQHIDELDRVLDLLYASVYSDESSNPSSMSIHSTENISRFKQHRF